MNKFFNSLTGIVTVTLVFLWAYLKSKEKTTKHSDNKVIDDAIRQLDFAFDQNGTDEEKVYQVFSSLTKSQIIQLYNDFGIRYYNRLTGEYLVFSWLEPLSPAQPMNLQSILGYEMHSSKEVQRLTELHNEKGLNYPFIR